MSVDLSSFYASCNSNKIEFDRSQSLPGLVAETARKHADKIAVVCGDNALTYAQLDAAANRLANHLIARGVKKGNLVGVCCNRNKDVPELLIGIMRSGAAYVPLDPDYPVDRLKYMAKDGELTHVVAHSEQSELLKEFACGATVYDREKADIEKLSAADPAVKIEPATDIAYVIYTSGSTGKPKGVLVPHLSVVNLMHSWKITPGFTENDRILAATTLSFDISVIEIFTPLCCGGQTIIIDRATAKDQNRLAETIRKHKVTQMQATPAHWRLICETDFASESKMKFITGGEPLPRDLIQPLLDRCTELWNVYGPTEATVWSSVQQIKSPAERILVGKPVANTTAYIVDAEGNLCPPETEGELLVGGDAVALGYLKREKLTAEKFVDFRGERVYRTGDLAKILDTGNVEHLGRIDGQIKFNGHRIELGEIEAALALADKNVRLAAAVVREDNPGDKRLVGYVMPRKGKTLNVPRIKSTIEKSLPDYMVPAVITVIDQFPYTPSGKIDRKSFPSPSRQRPDVANEFVPAESDEQQQVAALWEQVLQLDQVGIRDNFFELGGNSIKAVQFVKRFNEQFDGALSNAEFFDCPTIAAVIKTQRASEKAPKPATTRRDSQADDDQGFAVVGMAVRLPGADSLGQFWDNLINDRESIRFFEPEELDATLPQEQTSSPNYVAARGIIENATHFDANFFGVPPIEAELVDPQQRIMLELSWTALEDAGCIPSKFDGKIGVWAGTYQTAYYHRNLLHNPEVLDRTNEFQLGVYNEKDYIATRVAHKLNLKGPAINVNTACSTSLVAIIMACQSLRSGQCDAAIAGGVSVHFPQHSGHLHQEGSIFTPDGHCRPFDSKSAGTLFSDGGGCVVIKRLSDAIEDGDRIYAVVKGTGINNDGREKASFSAPSIEGQADAITMAHQQANIDASSIGYIEAHGTATPIGDPIEVAALCRAFDRTTQGRQFCGIGSVKSNVGHTVAAAGVTGFIKAALSLHNEQIPATLHYQQPNPQIDFPSTPFFVVDSQMPWPRRQGQPRRAGISSFGVGGTNAHVVIEEAPTGMPVSDSPLEVSLLKLSAKSEQALASSTAPLAQAVKTADSSIGEIAATLDAGRESFPWRAFCVATDNDEAAELLTKGKSPGLVTRKCPAGNRDCVFMFPGQGAQYVRMGQDLYGAFRVFRETLDQCSEILKPLIGRDLRDVLFPPIGDEQAAAEILKATQYTQPALFSIGVSLARTMMDLGIHPTAMMGHSIGEFAAACVAGVFSLEDGLAIIAGRGELMQSLPGGSMLSVRAPGGEIEKIVTGGVCVASYNGPELCVIAGPHNEVEQIRQALESKDIACKQLHTSHAFHSSMMDSIVDPYQQLVAQVKLSPPSIPILSTVTGEWMTDQQATDARYWAEHLRKPVRFSDAVTAMWSDDPQRVLIELGPRRTLATLAMQHTTDRKQQIAIPTMGSGIENFTEQRTLVAAIGHLWTAGIEADTQKLLPTNAATVSLPTYPYQRKQYFVAPPVQTNNPTNQTFPSMPSTSTPPTTQPPPSRRSTMSRKSKIVESLNDVFENTSGFDLTEFDSDTTFFEMGLDSLVLTQTASALKRKFELEITFRQMLEDTPNVESLADFIDSQLPADQFAESAAGELPVAAADVETQTVAAQVASGQQMLQSATETPNAIQLNTNPVSGSVAESIISNQLQLMAAQLQLLQGNGAAISQLSLPQLESNIASGIQPACGQNPNVQAASEMSVPQTRTTPESESNSEPKEKKKTFGAGARVSLNAEQLTGAQQTKLDDIIRRTNEMMPGSKAYAQQHRKYMADPRTVSGFRPNMKEMTHPIVVNNSKGVHLWDVDGNQYIDYTCGFGSNFLGHGSDMIIDAIAAQAKNDFAIGPQSPLAGEVAKLFCELTGNERMAFSNTGSEAVLGCTRLARAYTGKDTIVMFTGDYHGILDEVIVRGNRKLKSYPAATGIPKAYVGNTLILDYGSDEALRTIQENLDTIAAVVVETVQSRRPELQPREFLHKLRAITEDVDTALIFDEVITGFRIAPGGAQEHFGIRADLASYGKVVGGGMPIGLIGGRAKYMDGLDGGFWQYGDDSRPEAGMTYFAGTFVRHPLTLSASKAILEHIKDSGKPMYDRVNQLSDNMARQLNDLFTELGAPMFLANFGSLFKVQFEQDLPYAELLFAELRLRGFHIWDHRPCLLTVAHTQKHVDAFVAAFREVIVDLQRAGFVPGDGYKNVTTKQFDVNNPPCVDAKAGRDRDGNPGWFMADAGNPGQFIQVPQS